MRKYFDQNFKTKFSKQIMSGEKGFQWVIDEMENEFEYPNCDAKTFDEFFSILSKYTYHIGYFIRIYEIDKTQLVINNKFVEILNNIAKFAYKEISLRDVLKNNKYINFTSLYLLGIIAGFVQKSKIIGGYDYGMFLYFNWYQLHSIKKMSKKNKKYIESLLNRLTIKEKSKIIKIYNANFDEIEVRYNKQNLKKLNNCKNLFSGMNYKRNQFCTWQEDYILRMANLQFSISEVIPLFSSRYGTFPDYGSWNEKIVQNMKSFFNSNIDAIRILDIIDYRLHSKVLGVDTQKFVLNQCLKIVHSSKNINDFDTIWFNVLIGCMKDKKSFIKLNIKNIYVELKKKRNIEIILFLKEHGFFIDEELQGKIDRYNIKQINNLEKIEQLNSFNEFVKSEYVLNNINLELIKNTRKVFLKLIKKFENDMILSSCFSNIIIFFVESKKKITGNIIDEYIFEILNLWNSEYYEKMKSLLKVHTYTTSIETERIKIFNEVYLKFPLNILNDSFSWREKFILDKMTSISEHPLSAMIKPNSIYIDEFFPYYKKINVNDKDSLEYILCEFFENMQIKYEEQLLNSNMKPSEYLYSIYDDYKYSLSHFVCLLNDEVYKCMYNDIKESFMKYTLLEYPETIQMAYITQLIPLLEILIRELGIKNNILPFKEKKNQTHVMKDSSTILLAIIKKRYKENKNFNNTEVYMYLFNYLYNVNSLNLRNELIHAREYIENETQMFFAFKVLVIGIFWALIELHI